MYNETTHVNVFSSYHERSRIKISNVKTRGNEVFPSGREKEERKGTIAEQTGGGCWHKIISYRFISRDIVIDGVQTDARREEK